MRAAREEEEEEGDGLATPTRATKPRASRTPRSSTGSNSNGRRNAAPRTSAFALAVQDEEGAAAAAPAEDKEEQAELEAEEEVEAEEDEKLAVVDAPPSPQARPLENGTSISPSTTTPLRTLRRLLIRQKLVRFLSSLGPLLRPLLILSAFLLFIALPTPTPPFAKRTYVDENALQPASANVYWEWNDVGLCDDLASEIRNEVQFWGANERAEWVMGKLVDFGLEPHAQEYAYTLPGGRNVSGTNAYARSWSPRADGREAMVIAASWKSLWDGQDDPDVRDDGDHPQAQGARTNVRGLSIVLGLARHLTRHARSHWSKDLLFLFLDGHLEGAHAFTSAYFSLSSQGNLVRQEVPAAQGAMLWNGVAVDYPSDSFEGLAVLHTGIDGQLPNLDVVNTLTRVADIMGRISVRVAPHVDVAYRDEEQDGAHGGGWGTLGKLLEDKLHWGWRGVAKYRKAARNILAQLASLAASFPLGPHAILLRHHVDAITLYAVPARGPYGFWHMGRVLSSQVTSYSNLIERLHHSQFFYLLGKGPEDFVQLGVYLPVALLVSVALTLLGIARWLEEGRRAQRGKRAVVQQIVGEHDADDEDVPLMAPTDVDLHLDVASVSSRNDLAAALARVDAHSRPVGTALLTIAACHAVGYASLYIFTSADVYAAGGSLEVVRSMAVQLNGVLVGAAILLASRRNSSPRAQRVGRLVHAFSLLHAGAIIAVLSVLNWSAAVVLGFLVVGPLYLLPTRGGGQRGVVGALFALSLIIALLPWNLALLIDLVTKRYGSSIYLAALSSRPLAFDVGALIAKSWYHHHILETSCLPLVALAYTPLLVQAGLSVVLM